MNTGSIGAIVVVAWLITLSSSSKYMPSQQRIVANGSKLAREGCLLFTCCLRHGLWRIKALKQLLQQAKGCVGAGSPADNSLAVLTV